MQPFRIQLLVLSFFDLPAFCFHLSMLVFIIAQIRKKATLFRQGFYYLYAVVSVVDLYYVTVVSTYDETLGRQGTAKHPSCLRVSNHENGKTIGVKRPITMIALHGHKATVNSIVAPAYRSVPVSQAVLAITLSIMIRKGSGP